MSLQPVERSGPSTTLAPGWAPSLGLGLVGVLVGLTVAPGLTWLDAGELGAAAAELGIAHPPGFPIFAQLHKAVMLLWPLGDVAQRGNLASGLLLVVATVFLIAALRRAGVRAMPALFAALLLPLSGLVAVHAQTIEVYTGAAAWTAAALWCWTGWSSADRRFALGLGLLLGLALGHHAELRLFGLCLGLALCWRLRTQPKALLWAILFGVLGALVLLYLPLRSATGPLRDWGHPATLEGFWQHFTGARIRAAYADQFALLDVGELLRFAGQLAERAPVLLGLGLLGFGLGRGPGRYVALGLFALDVVYATALNPMGLRDLQNGAPGCVALAFGAGLMLERVLPMSPSALGRIASPALLSVAMAAAGVMAGLGERVEDSAQPDLLAAALDAAPPESLVLVASDNFAAGLAFAQVAEGARPDLAVIPRQHVWDPSSVGPVRRRLPHALKGWRPGAQLGQLDRLKDGWPVVWEWAAGSDAADRPADLEPRFPLFGATGRGEYVAQLKQLLALHPDGLRSADARRGLARLYADLGLYYLGRADGRSLPAFRDAVELDPDRAQGWNNLGAALQRFGLTREAITATRRAVALDPQDTGALLNLSRYLNASGQQGEAMAHIEALLSMTADNADALALRGVLRGNSGDLVGAKADFKGALLLNPNQTEALAGMKVLGRRAR